MLNHYSATLNFEYLKNIGSEGKNSQVHIAHDKQLDAEIVVKEIKKASFKDEAAFFNEAKILYSSDHPNIVPIQYSCYDDANIFITMPLFVKGSLNSLINSRPLTPSEILKYSIDFLCGLHHIHTKKLIHLDIKPTNILISNSNDALLTDFGLSKYLDDAGYATVEQVYELHQAPEMFKGNAATQQTDIYQAGLTIYRMCAGNISFKGQLNKFIVPPGVFDKSKYEEAVLKGKYPFRNAIPIHIPKRLKKAIIKALEPDPADRYNSVIEFLNDLCNIDVTHNWTPDFQENHSQFICNSDGKNYSVLIERVDDSNWNLITTKQASPDAEHRKITEYCTKNITFEEVYKQAKEALQNNSL